MFAVVGPVYPRCRTRAEANQSQRASATTEACTISLLLLLTSTPGQAYGVVQQGQDDSTGSHVEERQAAMLG